MDSQQPGSTFIDYELKKSSSCSTGELVWSVLGHSNELDVISVGQLALTVLSGEEEQAAAHWRPVTGRARHLALKPQSLASQNSLQRKGSYLPLARLPSPYLHLPAKISTNKAREWQEETSIRFWF